MLSFLFFAVLCTSCLAGPVGYYSYSNAVGGGSGPSFAIEGEGRVTAVRVWEFPNQYITGIQLRFGPIWSQMVGVARGNPNEIELKKDAIVQISGKYSFYIHQLTFVTSMGRSLIVGQPTQTSFNFYPTNENAELRFLSGRHNGHGITSLAAHWAVLTMDQNNSNSTGQYN